MKERKKALNKKQYLFFWAENAFLPTGMKDSEKTEENGFH